MPSNKCKPITLTQPESWIVAAKAQAKREGASLSSWLGECLLANLDADLLLPLAGGLGTRPKKGRPTKDPAPE
jgi:hypothetical protein